MQTVFEWKARRSGASITIKACDAYGKPVDVTNVDLIEARSFERVVALDKRGLVVALLQNERPR